ncbi:MAG: hypothetical protein EBY17_25995 [Acidobacteriia bacterium]|nr:hypothetical protein [Terriglobia bacterium]
MRLTPASQYADTELNPAIRDDERVFASYFPPGTRLQFEVPPGSGNRVDIPDILGLIQMAQRCAEYFMFCTSAAFDPRAFDEFGYDACVIIHDARKLFGMVQVMQVPARNLSAGPVTYIDPFMPHKDAGVEFTKHFRYRHQHEWRIVWTDPIPPIPLAPWQLELGNLSSFCELITL